MNIKDIKQYNVEAIKSIYKEDLLESESHSNDYILNNYFYNHIYFNSIECADKIVGKNGIHTFSNKRDIYTKTGEDGLNTTYSKLNSETIINKHKLYSDNQIISQQDIDWENAYLKYLDPKFIKSNVKFVYDRIYKDENGDIVIKEQNITESDSDSEVIMPESQYIQTTNDLLKVISYLLNRYNRLKRLLNIVKGQLELINE